MHHLSSILHAGSLEETNVKSSNDSLHCREVHRLPRVIDLSPGEVLSMIIVGAHDSVAGGTPIVVAAILTGVRG